MADDTTSDATTDTTAQTPTDDIEKIDGLGDKGKEAIRKEREARATAETKATNAEKELAELRREKTKREADEKKAAEDKAKADGEWERLASERETAIAGVTTERDALKETLSRYDAILTPLVKERQDAIKAANADVAKGFPTDAPLLDQLAWLDDPRTKALLSKQSDHVTNLRRWPNTPDTNGNADDDKDAKRGVADLVRSRM